MRSKSTKTFFIDNKEMIFNEATFNRLFQIKAQEAQIGVIAYETVLGEKLSLSDSAIHSWRNRLNGPGDLETIQTIADFWNIKVTTLLKEKEMQERQDIIRLTDRQAEALRKVNIAFMAYANEYLHTEGFDWDENSQEVGEHIEGQLWGKLIQILEDEYVDLRGSLYDELYSYFISPMISDLGSVEIPSEEKVGPDGYIDVYEDIVKVFREIIAPYKYY